MPSGRTPDAPLLSVIELRWTDLVLDGFRAPGHGPLPGPALRPNQVWRGLMRGA